jgi:hypothetical protein
MTALRNQSGRETCCGILEKYSSYSLTPLLPVVRKARREPKQATTYDREEGRSLRMETLTQSVALRKHGGVTNI